MTSKIIRLLSVLSRGELRALKTKLNQTCKEHEILVLKEVCKFINEEVSDQQQIRKEIFSKVFPKKKTFDDSEIRRIFHTLKRHIEDFLLAKKLREDKALREYLLLSIVGKKGDATLFKTYNKRAKKEVSKNKSPNFPFLEPWQKDLEYYHLSSNYPSAKLFPTLEGLVNSFDKKLILKRFFYQIEQIVFFKTYHIELKLDNAWQHFQEWTKAKFPNWSLRDWLIELLNLYNTTPEQNKLNELFSKSQDYNSELDIHQKKMIFKLFINIAKMHMINDNKVYVHFIFKLYKNAVKENILLQNKMLGPAQYINITVIAAADKQFEWLDTFIKDYSKYLPSEKREASINLAYAFKYYNQAIFSGQKGLFNKASKFISKVSERNPLYSIRFYSLSIRIAYETIILHDMDALYNKVIALKRYITPKRSPLSDINRIHYKNFANYTLQLGELKSQAKISGVSINSVYKKIKEDNKLALKDWLIEKVEELNSSTYRSGR